MQQLPHHYTARAEGQPTGTLATHVEGLQTLQIAAPKQFDGPGDQWSPEDLLVASAADCLILTFRAVASASRLDWLNLACEATGTLESVERITRFTELHLEATLEIGAGESAEKAERVLVKAEQACLVTNSLNTKTHLHVNITGG